MSIQKTSPRIVRNNLIWCVDGLNPKSYPGSGTLVTDLSGLGNHNTITGGIVNSGGQWLMANTSQYMLNNNPTVNETDPYSWFAWGVVDVGGAGGVLMTRGCDGFPNGWSLSSTLGDGSGGVSMVTTSAGPAGFSCPLTTPTPSGQWWMIGGVWTPSTSLKAYRNGVLDATLPMTTHTLRSSTKSWNIGIIITPNGGFSQGRIGMCCAYNRVLSDAEMLQNFNATKGRYGY